MQLTIPASPAHLAGLRRAVRASLHEVPSEVADDLVVALNEAATNAVVYGSGAGQPVRVTVQVASGWVEAVVVDQGPAVAPLGSAAAADDDDTSPELVATHGRGLWLLRRLVDEVRLERVRNGTRVTLRRQLPQPRHSRGTW